jgi:hypothetical protein
MSRAVRYVPSASIPYQLAFILTSLQSHPKGNKSITFSEPSHDDMSQELNDLTNNPIEVRVHQRAADPRIEHPHSIKGITYEPVEDNLFNWKCSIKGAVRYSRLRSSDSEIRAARQPVQGRHLLL